MNIEFERTGENRYAIHVIREGLPVATMDPAPGFDPYLPHDVMHLVVEAALGLEGGVFGQLAEGGLAGTFRIRPEQGLNKKDVKRLRRRTDAKDEKLLKKGRHDSEISERATYICWYEWLKRSEDASRRKLAGEMAANAAHIRSTAPPEEIAALDENVVNEVCLHLDALSACWSQNQIGGKMVIRWPDLEILNEQG